MSNNNTKNPNFKFRNIKNGVESTLMINDKGEIIRDDSNYATKADLMLREDIRNKVTSSMSWKDVEDDIHYPTTKALNKFLNSKQDTLIIEYGTNPSNESLYSNYDFYGKETFENWTDIITEYLARNFLIILKYKKVNISDEAGTELVSGYALLTNSGLNSSEETLNTQYVFSSTYSKFNTVSSQNENYLLTFTVASNNVWSNRRDTIVTQNTVKVIGVWG